MSAFLTVINDVKVPWYCKLRPKVSIVKWETMASTVVAAATAALAISPALTVDGLQVSGCPADYMKPYNGPFAAGVISGIAPSTKLGAALAEGITKYLMDNSYDLYQPGQNRSSRNTGIYEKIQSDCKKITVSGNFLSIYSMRNDITTGPTEGSYIRYSIDTWEGMSVRVPQMITLVAPPDVGPKHAFISIKNDSPHVWYCRIGPSVGELEWKTMASNVVDATTSALAISPALSTTGLDVFGVPDFYLKSFKGPYATGVAYNSEKSNTKFGAVLAENILKYLTDHRYASYMPGVKKQTTATLVNEKQIVDCKKVYVSDNHVAMYTLRNEVTTGSMEGTTNDFSIKTWEGKGTIPQMITGNLMK